VGPLGGALLPGQKLFGELGGNDRVTVLVDLVAGTSLAAKCAAYKGTTPRLDLALADPDGAPISLAALKKTNTTATLVSFKGLQVTRTGTYRLTVSSGVGTPGGFDLAITGAAPSKASGTGSVDAVGDLAPVTFEANPGDAVVCTVKPAKGSKLKPLLHRFVDAGGAETTIDARSRRRRRRRHARHVAVRRLGRRGHDGAFTWKLKFVRAKAGKTARDAAGLNAAGTVTGAIVVDGQATRPASVRGEKSARRPRAPDVRPGEIIVDAPAARSFAEVEAAAAAAMPGARCAVTASLSAHGPYLLRVEHLSGNHDARTKSATRALAKSAAAAGTFAWAEPTASSRRATSRTTRCTGSSSTCAICGCRTCGRRPRATRRS